MGSRLQKETGNEEIDVWARMRNKAVRNSRKKAPLYMTPSEHKLLTDLLLTVGIGRIVTNNKSSAEYVKIRIRKFLANMGIAELIGTSVQDNSVIAWRIAKFSTWRITPPVKENKIYLAAQSEELTLYQEYSKGCRDDETDIKRLRDAVAERMKKANESDKREEMPSYKEDEEIEEELRDFFKNK